MEDVQAEVDQRARDRLAVDAHVALAEVPAPRPHEQRRRLVALSLVILVASTCAPPEPPPPRLALDEVLGPGEVRCGPVTKKSELIGGPAAFAPGLPFVRPARPALERVMRRLEPSYKLGMLTNGPLVAELEVRMAERLGAAHIVALSSCTSGLMLVVQALTDGRSGPVVLPSFSTPPLIVVPPSFSFRNSSMISRPCAECRLPVGSSARMICGFAITARATPTNCCCPPESCEG